MGVNRFELPIQGNPIMIILSDAFGELVPFGPRYRPMFEDRDGQDGWKERQ